MENTKQTMTKADLLRRISVLESMDMKKEVHNLKVMYKDILKPEIPEGSTFQLARFITQDKEMLQVKRKIGLVANHNDCVLITGPTGTGKEILAHATHGDRSEEKEKGGPFLGINCAALPRELAESELFGHVKGAFTGANEPKEGLFSVVGYGTIFLDEIGELPLDMQAKLLRAIQEKKIRKVGGKYDEAFNGRVVCATLKNLEELVYLGRFREDLLYRINTFHVELTPLSERMADVPLITEYVATQYEKERLIDPDKKFPRDFEFLPAFLKGNVRSIEQVIRRYHVWGELPKYEYTKAD